MSQGADVHDTDRTGPPSIVILDRAEMLGMDWAEMRASGSPSRCRSLSAARGRYYSFQFIDLYTHNFAYLGSRAAGVVS